MVSEKKDIILGAKDDTKGAISSAKGGLKSVGTTWMEVAKGMLAWNVFQQLGRAAVNFVKTSLDAFGQQEEAQNRLTSAMIEAGTYTKEAYEHNLKYAASLQKITTYGDEEIIMLQTLLVQYGLTGKELDKATEATINMASSMKMDLSAAGLVVAKAAGGMVSSLGRYIGSVKNADGSTMTFMQAIDAMSEKFRGSALASAEGFTGKMKQLGNIVGDEVYEKVGKHLVPIIIELAKILLVIIGHVGKFIDSMAEGIGVIIEFGRTIDDMTGFFTFLGNVIGTIINQVIEFYKLLAKVGEAVIGWMKKFTEEHKSELRKQEEAKKEAAEKAEELAKEERARINATLKAEEEKTTKIQEEVKKRTKALEEGEAKAMKAMYEASQQRIKIQEDEEKAFTDSYRRIGESFRDNIVDSIIDGSLNAQKAIDELARALLKTLLQEALIPIGEAAGGVGKALREAFTGRVTGGMAGEAISGVAGAAGGIGGIGAAIAAAAPLALPIAAVAGIATVLGEIFGGRPISELTDEELLSTGRTIKNQAEIIKKEAFRGVMVGPSAENILSLYKVYKAEAERRGLALAEGGIVTRPTRALIGERGPEAVIPLEKVSPRIGNIIVNIQAGAFMGSSAQALAFAKMIKKELDKIERRNMTLV